MRGDTIETLEQILPNLALSAKSKDLLRQVQDKEITLDEFMTECAYWALADGFDDLRPKPYPTKPGKVAELENMNRDELAKIDFMKLCEKFPEVKMYRDSLRIVVNDNRAKHEWLEQMLSYIPEGDITAREKIDQRILKFKYFGT